MLKPSKVRGDFLHLRIESYRAKLPGGAGVHGKSMVSAAPLPGARIILAFNPGFRDCVASPRAIICHPLGGYGYAHPDRGGNMPMPWPPKSGSQVFLRTGRSRGWVMAYERALLCRDVFFSWWRNPANIMAAPPRQKIPPPQMIINITVIFLGGRISSCSGFSFR